ncbi:Sodium/calcium exchanger protein-domain-containing protein [Mycena metata]|uniref:Sodium/calcium exchanger protein-domain-containing protein n=1 Tax=Mycena metata TaxID=1033252 RepID=A0AAD7JWC4_9AGAR|nr:Sodium/calcium exchanger protein-domain-containing protein [Mycena metata]
MSASRPTRAAELSHSSASDSPAERNFHAAGHPRDSLPPYNISSRSQHFLFGWRLILLGSWLNILMIFLPISCILDITHPKSRGLVFIFSVLSLVPLVKFHDTSTRELAIRIGGSKTGLVNASLSNMVEIVVAISALRKCELRVVQSSLIGSMLSKLLLVLGLCLFAGGVRFSEQNFNPAMHSSLLSLSVGAVLLPAAYHFALGGVQNSHIASHLQMQNILSMSHGVSIVLLFIYASYLFFQLYSHTHLYTDGKKHNEVSYQRYAANPTASSPRLSPPRNIYLASRAAYSTSETTLAVADQPGKGTEPDSSFNGIQMSRGRSGSSNESNGGELLAEDSSAEKRAMNYEGGELKDERKPQLSMFLIIVLLVLVTVAVAITADRLVESMDSIGSTIQKPYVALIILPAVSSIAECMTAMNVSVKDELNFAISVAVGSTIQTALFVIPFMVTLAWIMGKPLALLFDPFESLVLYISVQVMTYVTGDGKSNYLEGIVLLCLYIIIAVSFWFYPAWSLSSPMGVCDAT